MFFRDVSNLKYGRDETPIRDLCKTLEEQITINRNLLIINIVLVCKESIAEVSKRLPSSIRQDGVLSFSSKPQAGFPYQECYQNLAQRSGYTDMDSTYYHTTVCNDETANNPQMRFSKPYCIPAAQ